MFEYCVAFHASGMAEAIKVLQEVEGAPEHIDVKCRVCGYMWLMAVAG